MNKPKSNKPKSDALTVPNGDERSSASDGDRDERGRFRPRNRAAVGRRAPRSKAEARAALEASVADGDLERVARSLVKRASSGDVGAARLLFEHLLGRPSPQPTEDPSFDPYADPHEPPEHYAHLL